MLAEKRLAQVLVVSDDSAQRQTVRQLLNGHAQVVEALTVSDALRALDSCSPDCTLVDYRLHERSGFNLLQSIDTDRFAVIVLYDDGCETAATRALQQGVVDRISSAGLSTESLARSVRFCVELSRARARAIAAEGRYRDLFDEAPVMYVLVNDDGVIQDSNRLFAAAVGCAHDNIVGKPLFDFCHELSLDTLEPSTENDILERYSQPEECHLVAGDGSTIPVMGYTIPEHGMDGVVRGARVVFINIARRQEAEEALRRSESEIRALLDANPDVLIQLRENGEELYFQPVTADVQLDNEGSAVAAHGALPVSTLRDYYRHAGLAFEGGPPVRFEYELDIDESRRTFEARLVRQSRCDLLAIVRERTRERELEQQLLQSQRLEAVGKLAGGVAHDFNNFLTVISGNAELALLDLVDEDPNVPVYREIVETSARAADLTRQLLAFSRQQILKPKILDLSELVAGTQRMLHRLIGEDIEIEARLVMDLPCIKADAGQIEQILMNLAVNARDAMPTGGRLCFETRDYELRQTEAGQDFEIPSGHYVRLSVTDTGVGMDDVTRSHVFEPFFTTKEGGQGTGLGLATVYGIVKQSGGYILVDSAPGKGTSFNIYFPAASSEEIQKADVLSGDPKEGNGETVVFVEDDSRVLALACSILERGGYRVAAFQRGEDAVRFVYDDPTRVDLLATDVVMPEMSGPAVADAIMNLCEGLPVLYMSGYTDDARVRHGVPQAEMNLLEKPFSRVGLLTAVRRALESRLSF